MHVELLAFTQRNPALTPETVAGLGDLPALWEGKGTFAETLIEYAGRVCYRSTQRMGTAGNFISDRVREQHEDIIEHVVVTVRVTGSDEPLRWRMLNRHCEVSELGDQTWVVSGNTRVWVDFLRRGIALEALPLLRTVAPAVFAEFAGGEGRGAAAESASGEGRVATEAARGEGRVASSDTPFTIHNSQFTIHNSRLPLSPSQDGPMRVTLLGFTQPLLRDPALLLDHGSATFLFEGISRACTHQLVRHRLASFSQESQRYVGLDKGEWRAIVPPAVAGNPAAMAELEAFWRTAEEKYGALRRLGIRKEDARFLLPNAAETRIITTMNFAAWSHFLWLRAVDKAAQWEIRAMGQRVLEMLHAIAPEVFAEQWKVYEEKFQ